MGALKHPELQAQASINSLARVTAVSSGYFGAGGALALPQARFDETLPLDLTWRHYLAFGAAAALLQALGVTALLHKDLSVTSLAVPHHVEIEFIKPDTPEKKIEPPPPPPPPKIQHHVEVKPAPISQPVAALRTPPAEENVPHDVLTVAENTTAAKTTGPVEAVPTPPPPPPKVDEPIVEPDINAAYRNNPPAEYPAFAVRQGLEGTVLLHVHILASGKTDKVDIKRTSGSKSLDDAAQSAVSTWTFDPIRRGSKPIDGWVTVPIIFKLSN